MTKLQAPRAFWWNETEKEQEIVRLISSDPNSLTHEELVKLAIELDRRFIQLWDKVIFENR